MSSDMSVENESSVLTMFACRFFFADWGQRVMHTRFEMQAPSATTRATCSSVSTPPSLTTLRP